NADDANTSLRQFRANTHRVFAAANDERVELEPFDVIEHFLRSIARLTFNVQLLERICARRTKIRATVTIPAPHHLAIEWQHFGRGVDQAAPTIEKTDYF